MMRGVAGAAGQVFAAVAALFVRLGMARDTGRRASLAELLFLGRGRVNRVTSGAGASALRRVICVLIFVAGDAGVVRRGLDVVRRMAACTFTMSRDLRRAQRRVILMTPFTGSGS